MNIIDAHNAIIESIDDPNAHNDIEISINTWKTPVIIEMTEALASKIAYEIANVLQNRAHKRTEQALIGVYDHAEQRRIAIWKRIKARKEESRA